ncbi:hypothetical protein [Bacteroides caecimuris]|uniref:hypothetical protein n=1 Tax=Bacteroides caecimuris TaxID=1796613 RepID=UPI00256FB066|nr:MULTISPECIES: hypothetical protein [Bacteroides]
MKIKLLFISSTPWDDNNSFGNSFSNIFGGNDNYEIYNIYLSEGNSTSPLVKRKYQISFGEMVRSLKNPKFKPGKEIIDEQETENFSERGEAIFKKASIMRWQIMFWARDAVWATGKWKTPQLDEFIKSVNPDIIFQPIYYSSFVDEVGLYAKKLTGAPMVGYISDDCYTLRQFSLSPLFWIDRLWKRRYVKRAIDECMLLYVITDRQKSEYTEIFGNKCKLLFKGGDFNEPFQTHEIQTPIKLVYTGNIGAGRWKTLAKLAEAIKDVNNGETIFEMKVYTATPISNEMRKSLDIKGACSLMKPVPVSQVAEIQRQSDIVVHVEPFALSERYKARLSFSTKIVDYLQSGRCILAIGWEETGGIEYLRNMDAAITITEPSTIKSKLLEIKNDPSVITDYASKGYRCGKANHRIESIRSGLYADLKEVCKGNMPVIN